IGKRVEDDSEGGQKSGGEPAVAPSDDRDEGRKARNEDQICREIPAETIRLEPMGIKRRERPAGEYDVSPEAPSVRRGFAKHGHPGLIEAERGHGEIERSKFDVHCRDERNEHHNSKYTLEPRGRDRAFGCFRFHDGASVPIPKFAGVCSSPGSELRNRRTLANL